jgi:hypothetical protein
VLEDVVIVSGSSRDRAEARRVAKAHYPVKCCVVCGTDSGRALDVKHLDQDDANNAPDNLAYLCRTHIGMYDAGLYPIRIVKELRALWQTTRGLPVDKSGGD